jgi:Fe-S-cluster-containing dehydrogenase component
MTGKRILIDSSKCQACKACQAACQQWHSLEAEDTTFTGSYQNPPDMSGANLTVVRFTEIEADGKVKWLFFKDQCRHCESPSCKTACPLGAIVRQANGMVYINPAICNPLVCTSAAYPALRPCQSACPFKVYDGAGIPRWKYTKDSTLTGEKMKKCDFCYNRWKKKSGLQDPPFISQELLPNGKPAVTSAICACQVACPPGAIASGGAGAMLKKAKSRVSYLKANGYPNANVYPSQLGLLTHVIWVLLEDVSVYGLAPI